MSKTRTPLKMPDRRAQEAEAWVEAGGQTKPPQPATERPGQPAGGETVRLNVNLTPDCHRRFKTACASEGVKMTEIVIQLVEDWISRAR